MLAQAQVPSLAFEHTCAPPITSQVSQPHYKAKMTGMCATFCVINSAVGVLLLLFMGFLCTINSPMILIPDKNKPDASLGCYTAAVLYVLTFVWAWKSMQDNSKVSAREVTNAKM